MADAVSSLPRLFVEDPPRDPRDAELFGRLVSLEDPEALAQFRSAAGGCVYPVVDSLPPHLHREDEAVMLTALPARHEEQEQRDKRRRSVPLVSVCERFNILAAALGDRVYFYDLVARHWMEHLTLHAREAQKNVSVVQFRRGGSPNDVLVAGDRGVCVWSVRWQERTATLQHLAEEASGGPVLAMECSPDGLHIVTVRQRVMRVWDVSLGQCVSFGGEFGPSVSFSADGSLLLTGSSTSGLFRVWQTFDWTEKAWMNPPKLPTRFACCNVASSASFALYSVGAKFFSRVSLSKSSEDMYEGSFALPFPVRQMAYSPCGRRLAIAFEGDQPLIGIVDSGNAANMYVLGYVRGSDGCGAAESMEFRRVNVGAGALLCVVWRDHSISFVELLF